MSENKEAALEAGTFEGGGSGQLSLGEVRLPDPHHTTPRPGAQGLAAPRGRAWVKQQEANDGEE